MSDETEISITEFRVKYAGREAIISRKVRDIRDIVDGTATPAIWLLAIDGIERVATYDDDLLHEAQTGAADLLHALAERDEAIAAAWQKWNEVLSAYQRPNDRLRRPRHFLKADACV